MSAAKYFTDEDVYAAVSLALRKAGFDAVATPEAGRMRQTDESHLAWAANQDRVLVTFNVGHFAALHSAWIRQGKHHAGIVVSSQRPVGEVIRRILRLAQTLDAFTLRDRLEYLSDW
jgi:predicted nuclease of predicted toxin-antitoxin system